MFTYPQNNQIPKIKSEEKKKSRLSNMQIIKVFYEYPILVLKQNYETLY